MSTGLTVLFFGAISLAVLAIDVGILTLVALLIYRMLTKRRITRRQVMAVAITYVLVIACSAPFLWFDGEQRISYWISVVALLLLVGVGNLAAYAVRPKQRAK